MKPRIVEVEWVDAVTNNGWHSITNYSGGGPEMPVHQSVGYVLRDDETGMTILQSFQHNGKLVADSLQLPRAYIRQVKTVRRGKSL